MNEKKRKPTDNDIRDEVLHRAELMAQALFKTKPISDRELRKKYGKGGK